jgi:hypothetical protein
MTHSLQRPAHRREETVSSTTISSTMVRMNHGADVCQGIMIEELCGSSRNFLRRPVAEGSGRRWGFEQTNITSACIDTSPGLNGKTLFMLETKASHGELNVESYLSLLSMTITSCAICLA